MWNFRIVNWAMYKMFTYNAARQCVFIIGLEQLSVCLQIYPKDQWALCTCNLLRVDVYKKPRRVSCCYLMTCCDCLCVRSRARVSLWTFTKTSADNGTGYRVSVGRSPPGAGCSFFINSWLFVVFLKLLLRPMEVWLNGFDEKMWLRAGFTQRLRVRVKASGR